MLHARLAYDQLLRMVVEPMLGDQTTNDHQLIEAGEKLLGPNFAGVFGCDNLPRLTRPLTYLVANTDPHDGPGTHWVAMCIEHGVLFFYDSFGRPAATLMPTVVEYATANRLMLVGSRNSPEQAKEQKDCGARSIAWLMLAKCEGTRVAIKLI